MSKSRSKRSKTSAKRDKSSTAEVSAQASDRRPRLVIEKSDLPAAAVDLARHMANSPKLFERGAALVKVVTSKQRVITQPINVYDVVTLSHGVCRPVVRKIVGGDPVYEPVTLPHGVARLYLNLHDAWGVRELDGICRAPLLSENGDIRSAQGYDADTRYWCIGAALPSIPENPSRDEAEKALKVLRSTFATFPYKDAALMAGPSGSKVDLTQPPGLDESTFLTALLTSVCRPSLPFAPGFIIRGSQLSGSGSGKGHLVRAIARLAYDMVPKVLGSSGDGGELDKRLTASLVDADSLIFLDNVNTETLRSNLLAQIITESPCAIRPFRENTKLMSIMTNALVVITGNALRVSEDLARRFLVVELDARCEDAEQRQFPPGFLAAINKDRLTLLAAILTIWRWGRRNRLKPGLPLGSFEVWSSWCRDPLIALGCTDPVMRIAEIKKDDPYRAKVAEFFMAWHAIYGDRLVKASDLDIRLKQLVSPGGQGSRQSVASFVANLAGTRAAGYVMVRNRPVGKWGTATYMLKKTED